MKKMKWIVAALAACALALAATGCDDGFTEAALNAMQNNAEQTVAVTGVSITLNGATLDNKTLALITGDTARLEAEITPKNASDKKVDWSSDNDDVVTVSADGTVTAVSNGRASITVTTRDGGFTATCTVTVAEMTVTLNTTSLALTPGDTARLEATVRPAGASGRVVEWSSDNPNIATVDAGGTVTAGDTLGTAVITATVGSMTATCEVTVKELSALFEMDGATLTKYTGNAAIVVIPDGVAKIDGAAFYDNKSLEHVTIPGSVESIGNSNDYYGAFEECTNLKSVTIPEGVTSIGKDAFYGCTSLTDVTIPASVRSIGNNAFCHCTSLTSVTIPDGVRSVGDSAFSGCSRLTEVKYAGTLEQWCGIYWNSAGANPLSNGNAVLYVGLPGAAVTDMEIPSGVEAIKSYAFYGYKNLTGVTIPASVTSIGKYAFSGCTSLTSVTIPDGVTSVGDSAFSGCSRLTEVKYAGTLEQWCGIYWNSAGANPLSNGNAVLYVGLPGAAVTDMEIPSGVEAIKSYAFYGYKNLTGVTIPASVTSIGNNAFCHCTSLTSVTIPDGVTSVGDSVFSGCTSLASVEIPANVTSIGWYAFEWCTCLTSVTYNGTKMQWDSITKAHGWNYNTGEYTLVCDDGTWDKQGNKLDGNVTEE